MIKKKNSKIMLHKIVDNNDTATLKELRIRFGYCIGDIVTPIIKARPGYWSYNKIKSDDSIKCSWICNRERPITRGLGRSMHKNEICVVLDLVDASNGRLTQVLTQEGMKGWVLSSEVQLVAQENKDEK